MFVMITFCMNIDQIDMEGKAPIIRRTRPSRWTEKEDEVLRAAVKVLGQRWKYVAKLISGRNERQCRDRYLLHLSPDLNTEKFTEEEDNLLRELYKESGPKWERFKERFKGRTAMALRNRWDHIKRIDARTASDESDNSEEVEPPIEEIATEAHAEEGVAEPEQPTTGKSRRSRKMRQGL